MYQTDNIPDCISELLTAINNVNDTRDKNLQGIEWVENGINDLYHYIEFETLSAPQRMKLFNKLRWLLKKRRELRNSNAIITEFKKVLWSDGKPTAQESQKVFNDRILQECVDKKVDMYKSPVYYPRVVTLQDALGE